MLQSISFTVKNLFRIIFCAKVCLVYVNFKYICATNKCYFKTDNPQELFNGVHMSDKMAPEDYQ